MFSVFFIVAPTVFGGRVWILFCYAVLSVHLAEEERVDCSTLIYKCLFDALQLLGFCVFSSLWCG